MRVAARTLSEVEKNIGVMKRWLWEVERVIWADFYTPVIVLPALDMYEGADV